MPLDGKILRRAKDRFDEKKAAREELLNKRTFEVYRRAPRVREIDSRMRSLVLDALSAAFSKDADPVSAVAEIESESLLLQQQREQQITAAGFPPDYLDDGYICPVCRDTGYHNGEVCDCLMQIYKEEQNRELSALLNLGEQTFDTFDLDYYDDAPDPKTGVSPRYNMEIISETCYRYAERFGKNSYNLFLNGGTGLGKTFLSACIARVVSEKGFSVVYDTAYNIFEKFEQERFLKADDMDAVRSDTHRYLNCDLLIMDDLGMEMQSSFVASALYNLINTRLTAGKKTIISSNLKMEELYRRYSPQVMSRLAGEYQTLTFYGRDIRIIKKERGQ